MIAAHRARRGFAHSIRVLAARNAQAPRLKWIEFFGVLLPSLLLRRYCYVITLADADFRASPRCGVAEK
jgi:hypothetical protein